MKNAYIKGIAFDYGYRAYQKGIHAPALDKRFRNEVLKGLSVGESMPYLKEWRKGYVQACLDNNKHIEDLRQDDDEFKSFLVTKGYMKDDDGIGVFAKVALILGYKWCDKCHMWHREDLCYCQYQELKNEIERGN